MDVGLALETYDLQAKRPVRVPEVAAQAARAEALGFASAWVMDHFWMERAGARLGGHDPLATLAFVAARTRRITLGTLVLCATFRHPGQLAREAAALADMAPGRIILGIGAGWNQSEHRAFDLPFDHLVGRLEETLTALRSLLRGERVSRAGRWTQLRDAEVLTTSPPPPLWVGGAGPRVLRAAARHADGWNLVWPARDVALFRDRLAVLRAEVEAAGRAPTDVSPTVGLLALVVDHASRDSTVGLARRVYGDLSERVVVGDVDELAELIREYGDAGAEHLVISCAPAPFARLDPELSERAAQVLPLL